MKEKLPWAVCIVLVACAIAAAIQMWNQRAGITRVPNFHLIERSGREVSRRSMVGEVWVADFVFTRCQWSCPKMCTLMDDLRRKTPEARFVSFTVDPEHDTVQELKAWGASHGVDREEWLWLTGKSREEVQKIAEGIWEIALPYATKCLSPVTFQG